MPLYGVAGSVLGFAPNYPIILNYFRIYTLGLVPFAIGSLFFRNFAKKPVMLVIGLILVMLAMLLAYLFSYNLGRVLASLSASQ
jgi:hypothetical protein